MQLYFHDVSTGKMEKILDFTLRANGSLSNATIRIDELASDVGGNNTYLTASPALGDQIIYFNSRQIDGRASFTVMCTRET